ncbi:AMP-binding protein [Pseudomonadota bacterium]
MHTSTLSLLCCPSCRCSYHQQVLESHADRVLSAVLTCPVCHLATPVVVGFPLFPETGPVGSGDSADWLSRLQEKVLDPAGVFRDFLYEKASRGHCESYAAFQPFNESTRALYPFLPLLHEQLEPGDVILDTWCRTGWSGELLAGLFPEQRVISIWEGNSNVLGYRGFAHWLSEDQRASNLDIIFTHPDHALPLADNSVRVIHGLDSLHRYRHASFIPECLRVCRNDGVLIFPHIHLTNSEPDPFFERGCHQYHGREWKAWLDGVLAGTRRVGWVLPEAGLFEAAQEILLTDDSETSHYNALVLIADQQNEGRLLEPASFPPLTAGSRFVPNPLLRTDMHRCRVSIDPDVLTGQAAAMLERHPCYQQRLERVIGSELTTDEARFCWHARQRLDLEGIARKMDIPRAQALEIATNLSHREILHPAPVSRAMADLQTFHSAVELPDTRPRHFAALWQIALEHYGQRSMLRWLQDGSELQADEVAFLVDAIRARLAAAGMTAGSRLLISTFHHPEALLVCWAAWLQGMVTAIGDPNLPREETVRLQHRMGAALCFSDDPELAALLPVACVCFDAADRPENDSFSTWLESTLENEPPLPITDPEAAAAVLFTSGSTGIPKGVVLSQRALCISGATMAQSHDWKEETLLSLGPLSMMSGLRNPAVAALVSGSTILVPGQDTARSPLLAWQQACDQGATVITAVPAWLAAILRVADRLPRASDLKQVLLTGTALEAGQRAAARKQLGVVIGDYYGLTETGGVCTATLDEMDAGTLGKPVNALLQILDEEHNPVRPGQTGRLRVHSDQLMSGYLDDPGNTEKAMQNGWLMTGDLAHWDEAGRLVLDGRADEFTKLRDGSRFHPAELETVLTGLDEVEGAAVLVVADGLEIVALVTGSADPRRIRDQLASKIAPQLLPSRIVSVPELPIGSNGKLVRAELPELLKKATPDV